MNVLTNTKFKAEASYKAQSRTQCPRRDAGDKSVYPWLDWLFSCSRYEADDDVFG